MSAPRNLAEILADCRIGQVRAAVVATLAAALPDIAVVAHAGKLDIADVIAGDAIPAPAILVGWSLLTPQERLSDAEDLELSFAAYVVVGDQAIGTPPRLVLRDELGPALCQALLRLLSDPQPQRWGLSDIGAPERPEAKPLFTATSFERGTAYYGVTWKQTVYAVGPAGVWTQDGGDL